MLINACHPEENRVAIVVDGILSELDIEIAGQEQNKGNIYKAVVVRVETGLQAAFVDYGAEKLGFLQIGEIHPQIYPAGKSPKERPRIADILSRGQEILVQIVKEERGNKGAALTTYLSIPGRYMVLMPDSTTKGVSRKIGEESERKKLKRTMAELDLPEAMGYIVRTAGIGKDKDELKRDFDYLVRLYEGIVARQDQIKAPAQLYQESNLAIRSIRDYFSMDMDEVLIDDHKIYQDARDFFALVMPEYRNLVKRHRERRPIFSRYQIEEQIEALSKNQIPLPSGGSIVIDQTEALVAIDVNSGKMASETGIEATAVKTDIEAAREIGRQLRLRDLGGLIVIDFIDMRDRKNMREVEQQLRTALKDDKAKVSVGRISQFGLLEMSRQRLKAVLAVGAYRECPHCRGTGRIRSTEAQAVSLLRQVHTAASKGQIAVIEANVPSEVADYILNRKRQTIADLQRDLNLQLYIHAQHGMRPGEVELQLHKREKEKEDSRQILPVSHANQIESALAAAQQLESVDKIDTNEEEPETAPAKEVKPRRRRRKKTAASKEQPPETGNREEATVMAADGNARPEEAAAENQSGEKKAGSETAASKGRQPKRKQATAPKTAAATVPETAATKPVASTDTAPDNATAPEQEPSSATGTEAKPRTRKPRSSTAGKTRQKRPAAPAATDPAPAPAQETAEPDAVKPVAQTPSSPLTTEPIEPDEVKAETPRKRSPRRTTKKSTVQSSTAEPVTAAATAPPEKQPEKTRPSRRRTKVETEPAAEASAQPQESTLKKTTPRRKPRSTVNKAAKEETGAVAPEAEKKSAETTSTKRRAAGAKAKPAEASEAAKKEGKTATTRRSRKKTAPDGGETPTAPETKKTRSRKTADTEESAQEPGSA